MSRPCYMFRRRPGNDSCEDDCRTEKDDSNNNNYNDNKSKSDKNGNNNKNKYHDLQKPARLKMRSATNHQLLFVIKLLSPIHPSLSSFTPPFFVVLFPLSAHAY